MSHTRNFSTGRIINPIINFFNLNNNQNNNNCNNNENNEDDCVNKCCQNVISNSSKKYEIDNLNDHIQVKYHDGFYNNYENNMETKKAVLNYFPPIDYYYYIKNIFIDRENHRIISLKIPKYAQFEYLFDKEYRKQVEDSNINEIRTFFYKRLDKNLTIPTKIFNSIYYDFNKPSKAIACMLFLKNNYGSEIFLKENLSKLIAQYDPESDITDYKLRAKNVFKNKYMLSLGYYHNYNGIIIKIPTYVENIAQLDYFIKLPFCQNYYNEEYYTDNPKDKMVKPIQYKEEIYNNFKEFALDQASKQNQNGITIRTP